MVTQEFIETENETTVKPTHTFSKDLFLKLAEDGGDVAVYKIGEKFIPVTNTCMNEFAVTKQKQEHPDSVEVGKGGELFGLYPASDLIRNGHDTQEKIEAYIEIHHAAKDILGISSLFSSKFGGHKDLRNAFIPCNMNLNKN